ncbi:ribose-phosphate pyrophosphokinase [bacterium]|nr:ribose-phosphate pyrophosphokinase [bacterium]
MMPRGWIFGLEGQEALVEALAPATGFERGRAELGGFTDGERMVRLGEELAGLPVVLVGATSPPVDSRVLTLAFMADAARRAGAVRIVAVVPYFGYARGERLAHPGAPIPCRVVADLLQGSGITDLVTLDLHSPAIAGFFTVPVVEASALGLLASRFAGASARRTVVVSPDAGGIKRASHVASLLGVPLGVALKQRLAPDSPRVLQLFGDIEGKEALVVDDMVTTGGTIQQVTAQLRQHGASAIDVAAVHPVMAGEAEGLLRSLGIRRFVVSDSIPFTPTPWPGFEVVSSAPVLAEALARCLGPTR